MLELLAISYSPWSEKARWALDARGISYRERAYHPILGEPELRLRLRRPSGQVSVPVLIDGLSCIEDSLAIARYAERHGRGPSLFPAGQDAEIERFVALSERGLCAGRALSLERMMTDEQALSEQVPKPLRGILGATGLALARAGVERTQRKYGGDRKGLDEHEDDLRSTLDALRAELTKQPPSDDPACLLGAFSFADIAMAQVLAYVDPPTSGAFRIGEGSRRSYRTESMRAPYQDLVDWRDALYARHRRR
jgi:glutathione S-transferase